MPIIHKNGQYTTDCGNVHILIFLRLIILKQTEKSEFQLIIYFCMLKNQAVKQSVISH